MDPTEAVAALAGEEFRVAAAFQRRWDKKSGPYVDAGALANALVDEAIAGRIDAVAPVLAGLEEMLTTANQHVRKVLIVGLLEGIQNVSLNRDLPLDAWYPMLGNATRRAWDVVADLWEGRITPEAFNRFVDDPATESSSE
jgi:hypothetical protein